MLLSRLPSFHLVNSGITSSSRGSQRLEFCCLLQLSEQFSSPLISGLPTTRTSKPPSRGWPRSYKSNTTKPHKLNTYPGCPRFIPTFWTVFASNGVVTKECKSYQDSTLPAGTRTFSSATSTEPYSSLAYFTYSWEYCVLRPMAKPCRRL